MDFRILRYLSIMRKTVICFILVLLTTVSFASKPRHSYVRIKTSKGESIVMLYNETPKHRDNFLKLAKQGFYNGTLFHRVIKDFMIQGGDPDSKHASPGAKLGEGDLNYKIGAEFSDSLFHKRGVIAAARDDNPEKSSSASQFYIVQGRTYSDSELDRIENEKLHRKIPVWQREVYKTLGGSPHLDQSYTVYGEVVKGMDMVDAIAAVDKDENDRPKEDIPMQVSILKKKEIKKLEKELVQDAFKKKLIMRM
jgi:cyclophilin family peptidyl-prolyl cis-trans isomerase